MSEKKYNLEEIKTHLLEYLEQITERSKGKNQFICPICNSGTGRNHTGAFTFYPETNSFHCFACGESGDIINLYCELHQTDFNSAVESLSHEFGIPMDSDAVSMHTRSIASNKTPSKREHVYYDENGELFAKKTIIKEADGKKKCFWNLYDPKTKQFSIKGLQKQTAPLYHVQNLKHAERIFFTEGEKDAELLERWEETATCTPNGAGQTTWHESYGNYLKGKEIIILTDNDKAGEKYGKTIAKHIYPIAKSVKIIPASAIWSDCPEKGDISDITEALGEEQAIALLSDAINKTAYYFDTTSGQTTYQFVKASEVQDKPISFLWYPYLPIGEISLIYARGGTGKTFLICGIAADVSAGEALPVYEDNADNTKEPEAANVLIISAEDSQSMLKQRIAYAGGDLDHCYFVAPPDTEEALQTYQPFELPTDKNDSDKIQAFKKLIRNTHAKLLIIDPWAAYVGQNVDMNRANDVRSVTSVLSVLAKELQIAVVIVAHVNKKAQLDSAADAVSGSADLVNGSRSCLEVRSFSADSDKRVIVHTKCNHSEKGKSICYRIISQGKGKTAQFLWDGFSDLTEDDLTKAARTGKPLSAICEDIQNNVENRQAAIDIIKDLAKPLQKVNVSYPEFRKKIIDETGENFLPTRPAKFLNSLSTDLRKSGIELEIGKRVKALDGHSHLGFTINCQTEV